MLKVRSRAHESESTEMSLKIYENYTTRSSTCSALTSDQAVLNSQVETLSYVSESITDEIFEEDESDKTACSGFIPRFKNVLHTKSVLDHGSFERIVVSESHPGGAWTCPGGTLYSTNYIPNPRGNPDLWASNEGLPFTHDTATLDVQKAVNALRPSFRNLMKDGNSNLLEALLELKDIKRLVDLFTLHRDIRAEVASDFLGINFGILPLYREAVTIMNLVENFDKRIDEWNNDANAGTVRSHHANVPKLDGSTSEQEPISASDIQSMGRGYKVYRDLSASSTTVSKLHLYYVPLRISSADRLRVRMRSYGLTNFFETAWNLLPFSFLVDYIVNIGEMVKHWEASDSLFRIKVVDFGMSIKTDYLASTSARMTGDYIPDQVLNRSLFSKSVYERRRLNWVDYPEHQDSPDLEFSALSGFQTTIVVALGAQYKYK